MWIQLNFSIGGFMALVWSAKRWAIGLSTLTLTITSSISLTIETAQGTTPYGPAVEHPQNAGYQAEQRGDFDTAIINYRRSLNAAAGLSDPVLRDCGVAGAEARLRGAEAAKIYIQQHGRSSDQLSQARERSQAAFQNYWNEFDQRRPNLVNGCP